MDEHDRPTLSTILRKDAITDGLKDDPELKELQVYKTAEDDTISDLLL